MANGQNPQTAGNAQPLNTNVLTAPRPGKPHIRMRNDGSFSVVGVNSPMEFFGPQQPLLPVAQPQAVGRQFDYPVGYNSRINPKLDEGITFGQLKGIADGYDVLRTIIERRKDELVAQKWTIGPKDPKAKRDKRCDEVTAFLERPDQVHQWDDWLRMLAEQMLVIDAASIYCRPTRGGDLYALELMDGAMIKRVITSEGRTPTADEGPAYQAILKGLPAVDYIVPQPRGKFVPDDDGTPMPELLYRPRNLRVDRFYGFSPVEQIVTTVNIALHRQFSQLSYYTSGSTPDLIFQVPDTWNPDQIAQFTAWWNALLVGNLANRRGTMFVPNGVKPFDTRERTLKDDYDEWLIRLCCFAFGVSPSPFIKQMNRATAQTHQQQQGEEGLGPQANWVRGVLDEVIALKFGYADLQFRWEEEESIDPAAQQTIYSGYIDSKVYHPDEVREKLGDDAMSADMRAQMDLATFAKTPNATVLPDDQQQAADDRAKASAEHAASLAPKPVDPAATKAELVELIRATPPPKVQVDNFVDVGGVNVQVKPPGSAPAGTKNTTTTAKRNADGSLEGEIVTTFTRTVRSDRGPDGALIAKVDP